MKLQLHRCLVFLAAFGFSVVTTTASAQTGDFLRGEATAVPTVRGLPFSAEGVVTLKLILYDGTRIERTVPARYYRDNEGRVRREQTIMGISSLDPRKDAEAVVTIVDPVAGFVYTLVGNKREVQRMRLPVGIEGEIEANLRELANATRSMRETRTSMTTESLGTRDFDGVRAVGRSTTLTIPAGVIGNDRPIEVLDEVWTAQDLKLQVLASHHDPRTGDVETRFTKIARAEPSADLFKIPAGYKIVDVPGAGR